jgi:aspartate ammonia-lyase
LLKISNDIRWLGSGPRCGIGEISLPENEPGSSIMPGKINPVIPEFVISAAHKIYSNDVLISSLSGQGALELNAYIPVIGTAVIESINLLISCNVTLLNNLFSGLVINETAAYEAVINGPSVTTALSPYIGYHKAAELARLMKDKKIDIFEANSILKLIDEAKLKTILEPGNLLKLGFSLDDL